MNEFNPDWDQMAVLVTHSQEQAAKIEQLEKQLAVQTYAADNYRRLLDESDHAYAELKDGIDRWKTSYSNAMDVNADLRAKLAEVRPLYTTPPQRTWVGLTDEEVGDLSDFAYANDEEFVRNVEKYLKEKNNG